MSLSDAIKKAAAAAEQVVAGVTADQLDNPTPCSDWNVRELGNHLTGFLPYSANAARKGPEMGGADEAPDFTAGDWSGSFSHLADDLVAAWSGEGAMEGETAFGPGMMPAQSAAGITLMELTVHGWDLATATGQEIKLDPETAAMAAMVTSQAGEAARESGVFGPPVPHTPGAGPVENALADSGRNPNWTA